MAVLARALRAIPFGRTPDGFVRHTRPSLRASLRPVRVLPKRRHASTTSELATDGRSVLTRTKNVLYGTSIAFFIGFGYLYITDTRASIHEWLVVPALRALYSDGEQAHHAGTAALKGLYQFGLHPRERGNPDAAGDLRIEIFGQVVDNPIGTSAGIDKNAEVPSPLLALGPGIVEIGGVTPLPQPGNPKPRVFRVPSQNAMVNRYGFNSEGAEHVAMTLRQRVREFAQRVGLGIDAEAERMVLDGEAGVPPGSLVPGRLLAVQVTKNKSTPDSDIEAVKRDFAFGIAHLGKYSDIIVVNVSSPNTPGLRALQNVAPLTHILTTCVKAASEVDRKTKPAVLVKVSPDEDSEEQVSGICEAIWQSGVDGVIVGNTTKRRPDPIPEGYSLPPTEAAILQEQGGYSGPQLFPRTLELVKRYRKMLDEGPKSSDAESPTESLRRKTIFATGGITNGSQALQILEAGASVAMVYTAMIYSGAGTISRIKAEMRDEIREK
ncbi:FMN-linked oxidoreductase [Lophium mytilinum]|uniref:Dihydroorotate dehydrogenase (quinone), mitochondrial n=1 Tax=Lophium mytilinum TaxID=390894 RepID=A0A6A6QBR1_9PEZI|nr:FMN-linked oxidoreductase [Lophium mytilinum]